MSIIKAHLSVLGKRHLTLKARIMYYLKITILFLQRKVNSLLRNKNSNKKFKLKTRRAKSSSSNKLSKSIKNKNQLLYKLRFVKKLMMIT